MSKATHTFRSEPGTERSRAVVVGAKGPPVVACGRHPAVKATFHCSACGKFACEACVERKLIGATREVVCVCSGPCDALHERELGTWRPMAFRERLGDACSYPLRGNGRVMFVGSTLTLVFAQLLMSGPSRLYSLVVALLAFTLVFGYVVGWWLSIVPDTVNGGRDPPDWPSLMDLWDEAVAPIVRVLATSLIVAAPTYAAAAVTGSAGVTAPVFVLAMIVFVPALANVALSDSLLFAFDPREWLAVVRQCGVPQIALAGCSLAVAFMLASTVRDLAGMLGALGILIASATFTWTATAVMRLLGGMLRDR